MFKANNQETKQWRHLMPSLLTLNKSYLILGFYCRLSTGKCQLDNGLHYLHTIFKV